MVRLMRGGTQAQLIQTNDLGFYVVKFINNPQHRRILANEMPSSLLLIHLGLPTPPMPLVSLDARFLLDHRDDVYIQGKHERISPRPGQHFGSSYPGSPFKDVVYEFLPDVVLSQIVNIEAFVVYSLLTSGLGTPTLGSASFRIQRLAS